MGTSSNTHKEQFSEFKYGCNKCGIIIVGNCKGKVELRSKLHNKCCTFTGLSYGADHFKKLDDERQSFEMKQKGSTNRTQTN